MSAIVYDLGGTSLRCGRVTRAGQLLDIEKFSILSFLQNPDPEQVVQALERQMLSYLRAVESKVDRSAPLVLSFPGPILNGREILTAPSVIGARREFPNLVARIVDASGRRVHLLNDLSAAARYFATTSAAERFLVVSISSGIGSKVYDRNHPSRVLDDVPFAGEIGHWTVMSGEGAPICDCGSAGHLGAIASGRGIERAARRTALATPDAFQNSACWARFGATSSTLTNEEHLVPAAREGDPWAIDVVRGCSRHLAQALMGTILTIGLQEVIVIGGFALALGDVYLSILREEIAKLSSYSVLGTSASDMVRLGTETPEACLAGAAIYSRTVTGDTR